MIAFVRGVTAASTCWGSMQKVLGSTSTITGIAPTKSTALAVAAFENDGAALRRAGYGPITTEIRAAPPFYYAESYHQQYLAKNPAGYCGIGGTGVACPVGLASMDN